MNLPDPPGSASDNRADWDRRAAEAEAAAARRSRRIKITGWTILAAFTVAVGLGTTWISGDGGNSEAQPTPILPSPSPSPTPQFVPPGSLSKGDVKFIDEVFEAVIARIRQGDLEGANEIVLSHRIAKSRGCFWGVVGSPFTKGDAQGKAAAQQSVTAQMEQIGRSSRARHFTAPLEPIIQHAYRNGRVVHDVTAQAVVAVLFVVCERVPEVGIGQA